MTEMTERIKQHRISSMFGLDQQAYQNREQIILRDYLALERTKLANERTLFSYIRTSLYLILAGFTLIQLRELGSLQWIGIISLVISILILIIGVVRYVKLNRQLKNYYQQDVDLEMFNNLNKNETQP
jgi:putative membrane protein